MIIISAMSENRVIGSGDGMPWNVPEEYNQYLQLTAGQTVILGRRSFEIFGDDLTCEHTIVVSRSLKPAAGFHVCPSFDEAVERSKPFGKTVFIAGGASIYWRALPRTDQMYLSTIKGVFSGDTYFPEFDLAAWDVAKEEEHDAFVFRVFARRKPCIGLG